MDEVRRAYQKTYYESHRTELLEKQKTRSKANYKAHPEVYAERSKRWRANNPERCRELTQRYWESHREVIVARSREWYLQNKDRARISTRRVKLRKYGLTEKDFQRRLVEQKGICPICQTKMSQPVVDHDHKTGRVRGLLCRMCNAALGQFRDSATTLARAIEYLNSSSSGATSTKSSEPSNS